MKFAFLQNKRVRVGIITLIFTLSVATVILVRLNAPTLISSSDTCALIESAMRFSKTGVASSALFPGFTEVITDPHPYPEMRWWATGAPKIMGTLIRWGLGPEAAYRVVNYAAIALMWLGWFLVVKEAGRLELLSRHPLVAAGFCLCPLFLTPNIDIDEMLFAAFVPWIIWLTSKTLSSRKWWLYLCILMASFWAGYQVRHASLMFPLLAMSAFGIVLLRKQETKPSKTKALLSLLSSTGIFLLLLYINSSSSPEYFGDANERKVDVISRFIESVGDSVCASFFWLVSWFLPGRFVGHLQSMLIALNGLGYITFLLYSLPVVFSIMRILQERHVSKLSINLFLCFALLLFNYVTLIYASIKILGDFRFTTLSDYWYAFTPLTMILGVFLFQKKLLISRYFAYALSLITISLLLTAVIGINKKALSQLQGYYLNQDGMAQLRQRLSFVQLKPNEYVLPPELLDSEAIFYTRAPQFYSLMYQNCKLQFRYPPFQTEFSKYRTERAVTLYFVLTDSEKEQNTMHLGLRALANPENERLFFEEVIKPLKLSERKDILLYEHLIIRPYKKMHIMEVSLPSGWRGKDASE